MKKGDRGKEAAREDRWERRVQLGGDGREIPVILDEACKWLESVGADDDLTENVRIVLAEALNNVHEHAYGGGGGPATVRIFTNENDGLVATISDQGMRMNCDELPGQDLPDMGEELNDMPEGGFGWFMIRQLTRKAEYTATPDGNCLELKFGRGDRLRTMASLP